MRRRFIVFDGRYLTDPDSANVLDAFSARNKGSAKWKAKQNWKGYQCVIVDDKHDEVIFSGVL